MQNTINYSRRNILKSCGLFTFSVLLIKPSFSDMISDLLDMNSVVAIRIWPSDIYTRITIESEHNLDTDVDTSVNNLVVINLKNTRLINFERIC